MYMLQELEEQNDRELCEMLDAIQFDTDEYVRQMRFGVPEEEGTAQGSNAQVMKTKM